MCSSKPFPGFSRLYKIGSIGSSQEFIADLDLRGADDFAVTRGEQASPARATAQWAMGARIPSEVVWTRVAAPVLLSAGLVRALREAGCSGWALYPVELTGKKGENLPGYFGLVVQGRCGPIDTSRSMRVMKEYPAGFFPVLKGLAFDERSWDGSDFFMPSDGKGWIFVTDRVKDAIAAKAGNVRFTPLDEVEQVVT